MMGFDGGAMVRNADCPVCGKKQGAFRGSSAWRPFDGLACSETCGLAAQAALEKLMSGGRYQKLLSEEQELRWRMAMMQDRAIRRVAQQPLKSHSSHQGG